MKKLIILISGIFIIGCGDTAINTVEMPEIFSVEVMMKDSTSEEYKCTAIEYHKEINTLIFFSETDTMLIPSFGNNVLRFRVKR
jgi:hypothetical protein